MSPTIEPGDSVLIFRWAFGPSLPGIRRHVFSWGNVRAGQIVAFRSQETGATVVKRVVAAPGQAVTISHGRLHAGNSTVVLTEGQSSALSGLTVIPNNSLFVAGDLGPRSFDSRHYGLVARESLLGRVIWFRHRR